MFFHQSLHLAPSVRALYSLNPHQFFSFNPFFKISTLFFNPSVMHKFPRFVKNGKPSTSIISGLGPTVLAAVIVLFTSVGLSVRLVHLAPEFIHESKWADLSQLAILYACLIPLFGGYIYYLIARSAFCHMKSTHSAPASAEIENIYLRNAPNLAVLIPAYKEELRTIRQTMMSAALVEYPHRRVTLLIDDPHNPQKTSDQAALQAARDLPCLMNQRFWIARQGFQQALDRFEAATGQIDRHEHAAHLAGLYIEAAQILESWAKEEEAEALTLSQSLDHTDRHFIGKILLDPATSHRQRASDLEAASVAEEPPEMEVLKREYHRLVGLFDVDCGSFERKRYMNLSHAANKAMNLNAYLGIMGGHFSEVMRPDGCHLEACDKADATISPPGADYILILDADSLILSEYALRLTHILEQPGNERIGLVQTPYSSVKGSPFLLERVASATTDLHYFVQQGVSHFNAAYWVGPNSLIRRQALDDIMVASVERGYTIKVYIQDRTVIEDTGSTIDMIRKGWKLHNYLARLAYSATPADFGALLIQRRRWANGGLILLPALLSYLLQRRSFSFRWLIESYLRVFTLISPTLVTIATLTLIFTSFDNRILVWWLPLIALPYYILLGDDLRASGYSFAYLPRVYAMNLLLLPIVLGGVWQSVRQILTGKKTAFTRTPKIAHRTSTPLRYLCAGYGILFFCVLSVFGNFLVHRYFNACFSMIFTISYLYALMQYVTFRAAGEDLLYRLKDWYSAFLGIGSGWSRPVNLPIFMELPPGGLAKMEPVLVQSSDERSMTGEETVPAQLDPVTFR